MKPSLRFIVIFAFFVSSCNTGALPLREGDIVFQTFPSPQCKAIQLATKSQYSHLGMVLMHDGRLMVYEAVSPVRFTSIDFWINRNQDRHLVVKRLKNADSILTKANLAKSDSTASAFEGRPYDSARAYRAIE